MSEETWEAPEAPAEEPAVLRNRPLLLQCVADIEDVRENMVIGPTAYEHLTEAIRHLKAALLFALDEDEQATGAR